MGETNSIIKTAKPIITYGNAILRKVSADISVKDGAVDTLIANLWNTLELSGGVGLAAPQINSIHNAFIVKSTLAYDDLDAEKQESLFSGDKGIEEVFINAKILAYSKDTSSVSEGCLSIPGINEEVRRPWSIVIEYLNQNFTLQKKEFSGYTARVIQHEYDHTRGNLFIDHLSPLTKKIIHGKLRKIEKKSARTKHGRNKK